MSFLVSNRARIRAFAADNPLLVPLATIAMSLLVLFIRRPDAFFNPQFWAEDALIFFWQQREQGIEAVLTPYAGYLHLIPRLIAAAAAPANACLLPALYNLGALLLALCVVARLFSSRLDLPGKPWLALAFVAVPHTGEVILNVTNIQWLSAFFLIELLLMDDAMKPRQLVGDMATVVLAGLTGPFAVIFLPLFAVRWWLRRTPESVLVFGLVVGCARIQSLLLMNYAIAESHRPFGGFVNLAAVLSRRVWFSLLSHPTVPAWMTPPLIMAIGLLLAGVLLWRARPRGPHQAAKRWLLLCTLLVLAAANLKMRFDTWSIDDLHSGDRYFFIPKVLVLWLIVLEFRSAAAPAWIARILFAAGLLTNLSTFRFPPYIDTDWYHHCYKLEGDKPAVIPLNPAGWAIHYAGRPSPPPSSAAPDQDKK